MNLKEVTKELDLKIDETERQLMSEQVRDFLDKVNSVLKKKKIKADVFVGGSFAKDTMVKSSNYDIDFFVRFDKEEDISDILEKVIKEIKVKYLRVHGSRDYFQVPADEKVTFEVIPVLKIKNPKDAKNVTDLSYFHVNYVKKRITQQIANEIRIAKQFLKAQGIYGAESYIGGISGYGVEGLIIHYKSFEKMIKSIVKSTKKIIIDPEDKYKGKNALIELNESKIESPIVLVDPTFKERNVLAALRSEAFDKLKKSSEELLSKPNEKYFEIKDIKCEIEAMIKGANKINAQFVKIDLKTDRQEGDIAGTKMKKFSDFLVEEIKRYFDVCNNTYSYLQSKEAQLFVVVKPKKEIVKMGPPLDLVEHAKAFRKEHKDTFIKEGRLYARLEAYKDFKDFFNDWKSKNKGRIKEMGLTAMGLG